MHETVVEFIERMGVMLEAEGLPRTAGRLVGFLLVHPDPYSLDDLAEQLQVSKASISTNARQLEEHRVLERVSAPGDRRDYYRMKVDAWEGMLRSALQKWASTRELLTATAAALPDEMEPSRARLIEAEQFHLLLISGIEQMLDRWGRRPSSVGSGDGDSRNEASPAGASEER